MLDKKFVVYSLALVAAFLYGYYQCRLGIAEHSKTQDNQQSMAKSAPSVKSFKIDVCCLSDKTNSRGSRVLQPTLKHRSYTNDLFFSLKD